jgi:hypothetical protein
MRVALLGAIVVLTACSSSSGSSGATDASTDGPGGGAASCATPACGGDVVGTWTLQTYCAPPGITAPTDTITFNADGTYSLGGGTAGTWSTSGTSLTEVTTGGATVVDQYCVQGGTLVTHIGISKGELTKVRTRS